VAGIVLIITSMLMIFLMMHHPTSHSHGMAKFMEDVEHMQSLNIVVHGGAIVILLLLAFCMSVLSSRLGTGSVFVRLAMIFYGAGILSMCAAATVSGFLVPGSLSTLAEATQPQLATGQQILALLRTINRTCDEFGVLGMSAGLFFWSLQMCLPRRGRLVGFLGAIVGLIGIAGLLSGHLGATVHGVIAFVVLQGIWNSLVGIGLLRSWWQPPT
jgi:hypothetical protein